MLCAYMVQVNVAIMMAPVTFLGHITSQPVEAMARMQTDRVQCLIPGVTTIAAAAAAAAASAHTHPIAASCCIES